MNRSLLEAAIADFTAKYQQCQAALYRDERDASNHAEEQITQIRNVKTRNIAIARNQSAQKQVEYELKLKTASKAILETDSSILDIADYIQAGEITLKGECFGVNEDISIPAIIPFIGTGNILVCTADHERNGIVSSLLLNSLEQTAPGQLEIIGFDPALTGALAPFSALEKDVGLLRVYNGENDINVIFEDVIATTRASMEITKGADGGIVKFRRDVNQPIGLLKVVMLLDFPRGITENNFKQFSDLIASSRQNGISFMLFCKENSVFPKWFNLKEIMNNTQYFQKSGDHYQWESNNSLPVALHSINDTQAIVAAVDKIVERSEKETVPTIKLSTIEDVAQEWTRSTANELSFAIGRQGLERIEVNLADEVKGTYNAVISGAVGQGKSNLVKMIVHSLCSRYSPDELNLYLLDFKEGVTLYPFSNLGSPDFLPQARVLGLESNREFGLSVLQHLLEEFERRSELIKPHGDKLSKYREANPGEIMPRIVLIIDEFHFLFNTNDAIGESAATALDELARKGRAYGIHIILASQTISGAAALMMKEDGIFGQIPVRIALKNNLSESYATFVHGNDGATRLRVRGQAVINMNYGKIEDNREFTVAYSSDDELSEMQIRWWNRVKESAAPPDVFSGTAIAQIDAALPRFRELRDSVLNGASGGRICLIGMPIDVNRTPFGIPMADDSGRNIALIGASESSSFKQQGASNLSVGIMQSIAISLALQHPAGDARFVAFDQLDQDIAQRNGHSIWLQTMERLGFPVEIISDSNTNDFLIQVRNELQNDEPDESLYIFGLAMDRAKSISRQDPISSESGLDFFREILRDGAMRRVHFFGAWSNVNTYQNHMGFGYEGYIETRIILRLNEASTQSLLGPFVHWSVQSNRVLVSDSTQLEEPTVIVPFVPLTNSVANKVLSYNWG